MTASIEEYKRAWEHGTPAGGWSERVTLDTAVLDKSFRSSMMGDGLIFVEDFGHAAGYCRGQLLDELQPPPSRPASPADAGLTGLDTMLEAWNRRMARFGPEELSRRWA